MRGSGISVRADEEGREQIPKRFVTLLDRLAVQRVTEADDGELRGDVGAVDLPAETGTEPGEEVPDVIYMRMGEEESMQGFGRHREAFDRVDRLVAFALEQTAIDREALATGGMIDEVGRTGNRAAGAERLVEERRGGEGVMSRQAQLHVAGKIGDGVDRLILIEANGRDGLRRVEQLGEFVEMRHGKRGELFGTTAHARPRKEVR